MENIFQENITIFGNKLTNVFVILTILWQKKIISEDEHEKLNDITTSFKQNVALIKLLMKKGEKSLPLFLQILRENENGYLADTINQTIREKNCEHLLSPNITISSRSIAANAHFDDQPGPPKRIKWDLSSNSEIKLQNHIKLPIEQWWPERTILTTSFLPRKLNNELLVERLNSLLQQNDDKTTVITQDKVVLSGLGGIGKTTLAKWFANYYENEYDHIIWIDCGEKSLLDSFKYLARALKMENITESKLATLAKECFARLCNFKCLLIFDNAECYVGNEGIRDVLPKCENKNLHSIITSRCQDWGSSTGYGKINGFSMNVFDKEESIQFFKNSLDKSSEIESGQLKKLGALLGHLPLALQIATATLNTNNISISEYIDQISKDDANSIIVGGKRLDDYELSINKTMQLSLNQIKRDENGSIAYNILMNFGLLQPDNIELMFIQCVEAISSAQVKIAISLLEKYSLVTMNRKRNSANALVEYVSIHRLLQQAILHKGKLEEKGRLRKILSANVLIQYKLLPYSYAESYEDLKEEFSHVRAQLIDQVKLKQLHSDKKFSEAVKLSRIIKNSMRPMKNESKMDFNNYLTSQYNYAVCLIKSNQTTDAITVFKSLLKHFDKLEQQQPVEGLCKTWFVIDNGIDFALQQYGHSPNKLPIIIYIKQNERDSNGLRQCYEELQKGFRSQVDKIDFRRMLHVIELILLLADAACLPRSLVMFEKVFILQDSYYLFSYMYRFNEIHKVAERILNLIERFCNEDSGSVNLKVIVKLICCFQNQDLFTVQWSGQSNIENRGNRMIDQIKHSGRMKTYQEVLFELCFTWILLFGVNEERLEIIKSLRGKSFEDELKLHGKRKEIGYYTGNDDTRKKIKLFSTFVSPTTLTSITLKGDDININSLTYSLSICTNLIKLELDVRGLWGTNNGSKIQLPYLKYFDMILSTPFKCLIRVTLDYLIFFGGQQCLWDTISALDYCKVRVLSSLNPEDIWAEIFKHKESLMSSPFFMKKMINTHCSWCQMNDGLKCVSNDISHQSSCASANVENSFLPDEKLVGTKYCISNSNIESVTLHVDKEIGRHEVHLSLIRIAFPCLKRICISGHYPSLNENTICVDLLGLVNIEIVDLKFVGISVRELADNEHAQANGELNLISRCLSGFGSKVDKCDIKNLARHNSTEWEGDMNNRKRFNCDYYTLLSNLPSGVRHLHLDLIIIQCDQLRDFTVSGIENINAHPSLETLVVRDTTKFRVGFTKILNLKSIPRSVKVLKIEAVRLIMDSTQTGSISLHKLILIDSGVEIIKEAEFISIVSKLIPEYLIVSREPTISYKLAGNLLEMGIKCIYAKCVSNSVDEGRQMSNNISCFTKVYVEVENAWMIKRAFITEEEFDLQATV